MRQPGSPQVPRPWLQDFLSDHWQTRLGVFHFPQVPTLLHIKIPRRSPVGHELFIDDLSCTIDQGVEIGLALFDMDNFGLQIPVISREAPEDIEVSCAEPSDARDSHSVVILVVQAASVRLWGTTRLSD